MKRILALLCFAVLGSGSVCAGSPTSNETRYTFLIQGNKAGFETSKHNADGSLELYYEFNDRGRGPKITEKVILDSDGLPIQIVNTGNDLDGKAPVDERFALKDRAASWKNRAEDGSKPIAGNAFYVSISGVPEEGALLARALLAARCCREA